MRMSAGKTAWHGMRTYSTLMIAGFESSSSRLRMRCSYAPYTSVSTRSLIPSSTSTRSESSGMCSPDLTLQHNESGSAQNAFDSRKHHPKYDAPTPPCAPLTNRFSGCGKVWFSHSKMRTCMFSGE